MKNKSVNGNDLSLQSIDALFGQVENEDTQEVNIHDLYEFKNHPFKVLENDDLNRLVESIKDTGIIVPILARPLSTGGYEIIAGHRRKRAAEIAGLSKVPVIIHEFTDDEATVLMVDSNIQREEILPSEKAFAYSMKMKAMKHQGKKIENMDSSADQIGKENSDSIRQVHRYIRLTYLEKELLNAVDDGKLGLVAGEELSYLKEYEQKLVIDFIEKYNQFPSSEQAKLIKAKSKEGHLSENDIIALMITIKPVQQKIVLKRDKLKNYFEESTTVEEMESIIIGLLEKWKNEA